MANAGNMGVAHARLEAASVTLVPDQNSGTTLTRRELLRAAVLGSGALVTGTALAACGSSSTSTTTSQSSVVKPSRGGNLRVGITGGGADDGLDGDNPLTNPDLARDRQLFNALVRYDPKNIPYFDLAEDISPDDSTGSSWTIRLPKGVTFHNGKDLTAEDVAFTFRRILNPKLPLVGAGGLVFVDPANLKILDKHTLRVPMTQPYATFVENLGNDNINVVPVGFDPKNPVGTGPFKYQSFTPGQQSVFVRNPDYFQHPFPYVDRLTITDYSDPTAQLNALSAGEVDAISYIPYAAAKTIPSNCRLLNARGGSYDAFTMRCDIAPFNDVRVRQALRLMLDREEFVQIAYDGFGQVGNDVFSPYDPDFDHSLQRSQDLPQARSLLRAAGASDLSFEIVSPPSGPGVQDSAQVFSQQAKAAGISVAVRDVSIDAFYAEFLKWTFSQDYWYSFPYLVQVAFETYRTAPFNEPHFNNPRYNSLFEEANRTLDKTKLRDIVYEMQQIDFNEGGLIIPVYNNVLDAYSDRLEGFIPYATGEPLGAWGFDRVWFTK